MKSKPRILVTNDDGVSAPGLLALAQALRKLDLPVTVLAPDHNWSAAGHVKTLHRPLRLSQTTLADGSCAWKSDGAPSDCVSLGMMGALEQDFDLVVSGINPNANIGLDVTYSGTVTAAMEASIWGKLGVAVSLDAPEFFDGALDFNSAAAIAAKLALQLYTLGNGSLPAPIYNVNVPYRPNGDFSGVMLTRQGIRLYHDELIKRLDPRGRPYYWIGGKAPTGVEESGTDYGALKQGYVSITPLHLDLTDLPLKAKLAELKIFES